MFAAEFLYRWTDGGGNVKPGIDIESDEPGQGKVAERGKTVVIRYDGFLHRGDAFQENHVAELVLGKRRVIAGLEYGIEGMRVGGRRRFRAAPHLCYRDEGVPGVIPPNALLIFAVDLMEVRE
jgi:FKBP-type peptidyl-prolyl cis-trans isomerase